MNLPLKLKRRSSVLLAVLVSLAGVTSVARAEATDPAQELPAQLDLNGALSYALQHNYDIAQSRESIREQEGLIVEVKSLAMPNASVNSSYTRTSHGLLADNSNPYASQNNWSVGLQVRQTLYAGGGVSAALSAQKSVREAALKDLEATIHVSLLNVRKAFLGVLLARAQITVQEQNVSLLKEQLQNARNRFDAGASSNFEVLRAQVAVSNAQPALIRARNDYRISIDQLRQSLGYTGSALQVENPRTEVVGTLDYTPSNYDLHDAITAARANRPELQRLESLVTAREAGVKNAKSDYLPDLAVVGGYLWRKNGNYEAVSKSVSGWNLGLQSNWAIFDGRATAGRVAQARSKLEQSKLLASQYQLSVEGEVRQAFSNWQEAVELVEASQQVVKQAEEALRLADARYAAGTATQLDVLTARVALTESRNNQLQANYSYNIALATLKKATGEAETIH